MNLRYPNFRLTHLNKYDVGFDEFCAKVLNAKTLSGIVL